MHEKSNQHQSCTSYIKITGPQYEVELIKMSALIRAIIKSI